VETDIGPRKFASVYRLRARTTLSCRVTALSESEPKPIAAGSHFPIYRLLARVKVFHLVVRLNTMASHLSYDKIQSIKSCQRLADFPKREAAATGDQMRKLQLFVLLLALVIGQGAKRCLAQSPNLAFDAASLVIAGLREFVHAPCELISFTSPFVLL
jgi:hypothetical protein